MEAVLEDAARASAGIGFLRLVRATQAHRLLQSREPFEQRLLLGGERAQHVGDRVWHRGVIERVVRLRPVADDSTATYWNPAGLPSIKHFEVAAVQQGRQTTALNLGTNEVGSQDFFFSGGMTLPKIGTFGAAM